MNEIRHTQRLSERVVRMRIHAPDIAARARAGQFVVLRVTDTGERIPLTITEALPECGEITLIVQESGTTTMRLGALPVGAQLPDVVGPLGRPTEIKRFGTVIAVGGGVGVAELFPVVKALTTAGNTVRAVIGARSKDLVILEHELSAIVDELSVSTDDGSSGVQGTVVDALISMRARGVSADLVYVIGPLVMMRAVSLLTRAWGVRTVASLNTVMLDATGMCGACRVTVGGVVRLACVEGPEFDAHQIDWEELIIRSKLYADEEAQSLQNYRHRCALRQTAPDS